MEKKENRGNKLKSLIRALRLLKLFAQRKNWSINELIIALEFHKSTVQRLVTTLESEGFIERVYPHKGIYQLGPQILHLGNVASHSNDLRTIAQPYLAQLCDKTQETTHLCVVSESQCYYLEKIDSPQSIRLVTFVGQRMPLHSTGVGKALMSGMSIKQIDKVIAEQGLKGFTVHTITDRDKLLEEIARIRKAGVSFDREEMETGLRCVAAPIFESAGNVVAAVSISGPSQRMDDQKLMDFSILVKETALQISERLGYVPRDRQGTVGR